VLYLVAYLRAQDQQQALQYTSIGIMATAGIGFLLSVPLINGIAQNNVANPTMGIVVGEVLSVLVRGFAVQSLLLFFIGLILFVVNHHNATQSDQAKSAPAPEEAPQLSA
jgi:cbb3-type cytochrome oxidase subunit 3